MMNRHFEYALAKTQNRWSQRSCFLSNSTWHWLAKGTSNTRSVLPNSECVESTSSTIQGTVNSLVFSNYDLLCGKRRNHPRHHHHRHHRRFWSCPERCS